jgi:hypothetical protein
MVETSAGRYEALSLGLKGEWDVTVSLRDKGADSFEARARMRWP